MKELRGSASAVVSAPLDESFALLAAVDRYPEWHPDLFREVDVLERGADGQPRRAWAKLRVAFSQEIELTVGVRSEWQQAVYLTRLPNEPGDPEKLDLSWRLDDDGGTRISLEFSAAVEFLPGFLPVGGAGNKIARSVLKGAVAKLGEGRR